MTIAMWILALLMLAVFVAPLFVGRHGISLGKAGVGLAFASVFIGFALLASAGSRRNPDRLRRVFEQPRTALWIYMQVQKVRGVALYRFIMLRLADGSLAVFSAPWSEADRIFATLRAHLSHAIVGFGRDQQARYDAARRALRSAA